MNKLFFVLFLCLISLSVFAFTNYSNFVLKDVLINPKNYARLPDDLSPYCCGSVVGGVCDSKVDLETASKLVDSGLDPSASYVPDKSSLRCD